MPKRDVVIPVSIPVTVSGEAQIDKLERQIEALNEDIDSYSQKLSQANKQIADLQQQIASARDVSGIRVLEEELQTFKQTAAQAEDEVRTFLQAMNLDDLKYDDYVADLIRNVKEGAITANQAIASIKANFQHMMEDNYQKNGGLFDSQQVQAFLATLDQLSQKVDVIHQKIVRIETDGVAVAGGGGTGGGGIGANLSEQFRQIAATAELMSDKGSAATQQISSMIEAISAFANLDTANLLSVSHTFENIANIGQGSFSSKSVENLVDLARKISLLNESGNFRFNFNLEGLKDFKVSSTIHHLSDFLATLNNEQISSLERLSRINLSNFHQDNLKISKASFDHLRELVQLFSENPTQTTSISAAMDKASEAADRAEKEYIEEAEAIHQVDTAYQETIQVSEAAATEIEGDIHRISDAAKTETAAVQQVGEAVKSNAHAVTESVKAEIDVAEKYAKGLSLILSGDWFVKDLEKSFSLGSLMSSLKKGDLKLIQDVSQAIFADHGDFRKNWNEVANYISMFAKSEPQLRRVTEFFNTAFNNPILMNTDSLREQMQLISDYVSGNWLYDTKSLTFKLFSDWTKMSGSGAFDFTEFSSKAFAEINGISNALDYLQDKLRGAAILFQGLVSYTSTNDLDVIHLNGIAENYELIQTIAEKLVRQQMLQLYGIKDVNAAIEAQKSAESESLQVVEQKVKAEDVLAAIIARRRQAAIDAAQAEQLYQKSLQSTALVPRTAGALAEEQSQLQNLNRGYLEHVPAARAAAEAENEKAGASRNVAGAIDAEISEVREATSAEEQHAKAIGTTSIALLEAAKAEKQSAEEAKRFREILLSIMKAQQDSAAAAYRYAEAMFRIVNAVRQIGTASGNIPLLTGGQSMQTTSTGIEEYRDVILETEQLAEKHTRTEEMLAKSIDATFTEVNESVGALNAYNNVLALNAATESTAAEATNATTEAKQAEKAATEESKNAKQQEAEATKAQAEAEKEAAAAAKEQEKLNNKRVGMIKNLNNMLVQCEAAQRKYALAAKLGLAGDSYKSLPGTINNIRELITQLNSGADVTKEMDARFKELQITVSNTSRELKTSGGLLGRWATTGMQQLTSRLSYSIGLAAMVYKAAGEIKKMVSTAVELDTAMNQLQIVTRSSSADMDVYAKRVSAMAKETAQATKDLIDASTVYARLGYSMDDSATLAKYTAQLQNVGNIEAGAAQDAMTAILKAFDKDVDDVEDVMNKLVVVGKIIAQGCGNAA